MDKAFWGSRYLPEDKDYLNCPLTEEQYRDFVRALVDGDKVKPREFEKEIHFEGCMPVEALAESGEMTLAFGALKPVGLIDPKTGEQPFAVLQLRAENKDKTSFNLVGFQTKLTYPEQKRIFRMIPGLEKAEFLRLGSIHRNTYVNAPEVLDEDLSLKAAPNVHLAGQITGVEGYLESAACGLWLGLHLAAGIGHAPETTALGALLGPPAPPCQKIPAQQCQFRAHARPEQTRPEKKAQGTLRRTHPRGLGRMAGGTEGLECDVRTIRHTYFADVARSQAVILPAHRADATPGRTCRDILYALLC